MQPDDSTRALLERIASKSTVRMAAASLVSWDATGAVIDVGDGRVSAAFGTSYLPEIGERVLVEFIDGAAYIRGPAVPRPAGGTVTAVASSRVTLDTPVGQVGPLPYVGSAPVVGQTMRILWHGGGIAFTATDSIIPAPPEPPPPPAKSTHVDEFDAIEAGTWNTGGGDSATSYFNEEVWASNTTIGFWFYGTKVPDTIPPGASIQRVQLYIAARQIQGDQPVFTTHDRTNGPGTSLSGGVARAVRNYEYVDLPTSFGDQLKRGGGRFGIGTRHGGYNIFKSRRGDGQTGKLRITSIY